jgi:prepilin-type N-terminal cleavage/methylation domain-containing protein
MSASRASGFSLIELLVVIGISTVAAAIAVPMMGNTIGNFRLNGDANSLRNAVSLTKLRAASDFSKSRLYVDLSLNTFHIETWNTTTAAWVTEGGTTALASGAESYSFGVVSTPPANTQGAIGQAPKCLTAAGVAIGNTACVVFNSRGIPVTDVAGTTGSPTNADALYITDGTAVYGITVSATSVTQLWRTGPSATPAWALQ